MIEVETYWPFPKQQEFHRCPAKYRLFGGAAGPGKSKAVLMEAVQQAHEHPNVDTLVMRRTFAELEQSMLLYFRRDIPRELYRSYNDSKHVATWHNGSTTRFGYCQSENDVYQYQGGEYLFIGIDELTLFTLRQWQFLTSRNRCSVAGTFPNMAGATNPGNIGHAWVKSLWIDRRPAAGMERPEEYDASDYAFIPAYLDDNPIYANDANYRKTLEALPTHLRNAFLLGDWDVFAGQYFDIWSAATMVDRPEDWDVKPWWPVWISVDWGFEHPAAVYWHTIDPEKRTLTKRELVVNHVGPKELTKQIADLSGDEKISEIYLSPDAFAKRTDEQSIADQMGDVFAARKMPRPTPADNDRVGGWMVMYQMLKSGFWRIGSTCVHLIACLPNLVRDTKHVEDVQKMDGDDTADSARYGLKSKHSPGVMPFEEKLRQDIRDRGITDPTSKAIYAGKAVAAHAKAEAPGGRLRWMRGK